MTLYPDVQTNAQEEVDRVTGSKPIANLLRQSRYAIR